MADVRSAEIHVQGVKIGECTQGSYEINSGVGSVMTSDGMAFTVGQVVCNANITTIIPRVGMETDLYEVLISQLTVQLTLYFNGGIHTFEGKFTTAGANWDVAAGSCTGTFSFVGATPAIKAI